MGRWDKRGGGTHKPMPRPYRCPHCGKTYAVEWALENHVRLCKDRKRVR